MCNLLAVRGYAGSHVFKCVCVCAGGYDNGIIRNLQVHLSRLSTLLAVDVPTAEAVLSELVAEKSLWARIDRPSGEGWVL